MSASCIELVLDVEGAEGRVFHQQMLLEQAEAADVQAGGVGGRPRHEAPAQLVSPFKTLQIPHIFA